MKDRNKKSLYKINLHYIVLQSLYWMGYATVWASRSAVLLYKGCSNAQTGAITAISLLSAAFVFQPAMSSLADRSPRFSSRRFSMALCVAAACASLIMWNDACPLPLFAVLYILIGVCLMGLAPFLNSMSMALVLDGIPVDYGLGRGIGSGFYAVGALSMGFLLEGFRATIIFPLFSAVFFLLCFSSFFFRYGNDAGSTRPPESVPDSQKEKRALGNLALLKSYPAFTCLIIGYALMFSSHGINCTYMIHITERAGGGKSEMGIALAIGALVEVPAMMLFTRLREKTSLKFIFRLTVFGFFIRNLLFLIAPSMTVVYITVFLQFLECGISIPATVYYVAQNIDKANQVKGQSLLHLTSNGIGSALGTLIAGQLLDSSGVHTMLIFAICCSVAGGLIIIAATRKDNQNKGIQA